MQLKRMTAYGFKSFADKIEIDFDVGVTAIVGPNGSGKSNITDAIRWALGEQNVRNLRGQKTEDIIFTGSNQRRALNVAEVSLTFSNEDGRLPVDFAEVIVTRRLFRSGESECYINKVPCRLKDIHQLLADTGVGREGISIIGQNNIDEILNSKPEERRIFFEDAAGITKYRGRRREATRKLEDTEMNLIRVTDIIEEIDRQLIPLAAEAEKTRTYNEYTAELAQVKISLILGRYEAAKEHIAALTEKIAAAKDEEIAAVTVIETTEARKQELAKAIIALEEAITKASDELAKCADAIKDKESDLRLFAERTRSEEEKLAGLRDELADQEAAIKKVEDELKQRTETHQSLTDEEKILQEKLLNQKQEAKEVNSVLREKNDAYRAAQTERARLENEAAQKRSALAILDRDIDSETERRAKSGEAEKLLADSLEKLETDIAAKTTRQTEVQTEQSRITQERQMAAKELRQTQDKLNMLRQENRTVKQFISQAEAKLQVLNRLQETYEGFGRAPRAILAAHEPWRSGVAGAVAELLEVEPRYVVAIEIALGPAQQYIVSRDMDTAKKAIDYLKYNRLGRVTFLPLSTLNERQPINLPDEVKKMAGYLGIAHELVTTAPEYEKVSRFLLASTIVADGFDNALAIAKHLGFRYRIVTLEGELLNPGGSVSGGSTRQTENGFLNRRGEIQSLNETLAKKRAEDEAFADGEKSLQIAIEEKGKAIVELEKNQQSLLVEAAELKVSLKNLEDETKRRNEELENIRLAAAKMQLSFAEAQKKRVYAHRELLETENAAVNQGIIVRQLQRDLDEAEQIADDMAEKLHQSELDSAVIHEKIVAAKERILLKEREKEDLAKDLAESRQAIAILTDKLAHKDDEEENVKRELTALQREYGEKNAVKDKVYQEKMQALAASQAADEAIRQINQKLVSIRQDIQKKELAKNRVEYAAEEAEKNLAETYQVTIAAARERRLDFSEATLGEKSTDLEKAIADLGLINPRAIEEHDTLKKRRSFLAGQAADLVAAKDDLTKIITEIDATMTKKLSAAFMAISRHFNDCFTALFDGGEASLFLTKPQEVLNTGVEILVTIPEKKRQNLSVLSGGERALTVIALLFAVLRFSPSPFAILDEIDAPLDEANITRFGGFLNNFSQDTQFIIVTHRKGTMSAADTIYGVTLEDAGVSKIISVKLEAEE